jgi:hypothetical protein
MVRRKKKTGGHYRYPAHGNRKYKGTTRVLYKCGQ